MVTTTFPGLTEGRTVSVQVRHSDETNPSRGTPGPMLRWLIPAGEILKSYTSLEFVSRSWRNTKASLPNSNVPRKCLLERMYSAGSLIGVERSSEPLESSETHLESVLRISLSGTTDICRTTPFS